MHSRSEDYTRYCKTLFFRSILISQFSYVENLLHFNLAYFPVNIIKQFVSCSFWCLYKILLSKFLSYYYLLPRILHIIYRSVDILCTSTYGDGQLKNLHVFNFAILLKSRKFDAREIYVLQYCISPVRAIHHKLSGI